jgi:hypothetical protein
MNIASKEIVISELQDYLKISLFKMPKYRVFYNGIYNMGDLIICTPESKLHLNGHGWIDITYKQVELLKKAKISIIALRLEGNKVYYITFYELLSYLTPESMYNNSREGNHWKLYIWPKHIEIRGNAKKLLVEPNKIKTLSI